MREDKMQKPIILVVDDSNDYREQVSKFLSRQYYVNLLEAKDGASAVSIMRAQECDVVIMDIKMPGQGGIDALEEIKNDVMLSNVIILSGWSDPQVISQAMQLGVFAYISKSDPDIFAVFSEKVESLLSAKGKLVKLKD